MLFFHALDPQPLAAGAREEVDAQREAEPGHTQADEQCGDPDHRLHTPIIRALVGNGLATSQEIVASRANGTDMEKDTAVRDATRRTRLANERTYLAWWRTGLTALAISFGAGRLLPELSHGPNWPFEVVGIAFAVVGIVFMTYGYVRHREVDAALDRGVYESLPDRAAFALAAVGGLLGVATVLLVAINTS